MNKNQNLQTIVENISALNILYVCRYLYIEIERQVEKKQDKMKKKQLFYNQHNK